MHNEHLNLARKWRSKNFQEIIGQDLSVKMLRNSLYLNQLFPVYLFAGQKGCGKTSTARVFAAAINCEQLPEFQRQPKTSSVPCLQCASCVAMSKGQHPDFIEVDAASHTGVDNVRNIIESSTFLPLMGRKKIYLIDEAHMLSKAAFNALLKVLEEPSASTLFILATTDMQKILETVRSRCFQLFFKAVDTQVLFDHLQRVCTAESISFEETGLATLIHETEGSVRDALNLLEQVRFSSGAVTKSSVNTLLGHVDDENILKLFSVIIQKEPHALLTLLNAIDFSTRSVDFMWRRLTEMVRAALWLKYKVEPEQFVEYQPQLQAITDTLSSESLRLLFEHLCSQEQALFRTTAKHSFFEMILLQLCAYKKNRKGDSDNNMGFAALAPHMSSDQGVDNHNVVDGDDLPVEDDEEDESDNNSDDMGSWKQFLLKLDVLKDPLLSSIFKQACFKKIDTSACAIIVEFSKEFVFFKDLLTDRQAIWHALIIEHYGQNYSLMTLFTGQSRVQAKVQLRPVTQAVVPARAIQPVPKAVSSAATKPFDRQQHYGSAKNTVRKPFVTARAEPRLEAVGPRAAMLLKYFPGTITQMQEQRV